ncbi:MarR family winged helix-turn-helix transcriptional regulator [Pedobacter miscanthi]|uniref:MarR family winged helix-turn-helix transcriptional regulator n=1 Tax=Pedobacter miscanthi TaxID=2259170 RepID=UPI00292E5C2B|nr:MarR family transcriptional regulator [Pedobacter miscanthi]
MESEYNTFSVEKAEDSSGFLLWQVTNLWQREIRKALEEYNITHSQFVLLASIHWLSVQKKEITQILLSTHTKIDPMTTSSVLKTLQKKELIQRSENLTDTRAKTVVLTEAGLKLIAKAVVTVEKFDRDFFSILSDKARHLNKDLLAILENQKSSNR